MGFTNFFGIQATLAGFYLLFVHKLFYVIQFLLFYILALQYYFFSLESIYNKNYYINSLNKIILNLHIILKF